MADDLDGDHLRALGVLFPQAIHALSQPASVLNGYLDLMAAGVEASDQERSMERLRIATARITELLTLLRHAHSSPEAVEEVLVTLREYRSPAREPSVSG